MTGSPADFEEEPMSLPDIVTQQEWLAARRDLLAREKEHTRQRDTLNADRRRLPMTIVERDYRLQGQRGAVGLADLFGGCRQLVVQHVMFGPDWEAVCPGCTAGLDELAPAVLAHMRTRDTAFAGVSRAPFDKLAAVRSAKGWQFDWYSSYGSDFNYDFHATLDPAVAPPMFNFQPTESGDGEVSGFSCFLRDGDRIFHTYSTWARGADQIGSSYTLLDLTALGRSENWEEPKGRVAEPHPADPTFRS
jgi:predicted dithiol-disulfide oxidoreductase (DUF899 family)